MRWTSGIDRAERGSASRTRRQQRAGGAIARRGEPRRSGRRTAMWVVGGRSRRCCCRASASKRRRWISCRKGGADLAEAASIAARSADVQSLRVRSGKLDLDRVRAMAAPLASVTKRARQRERRVRSSRVALAARARCPQTRRVHDRCRRRNLRRRHRVAKPSPCSPTCSVATVQRQYFVVFATPVEARDLGGFMGAYGVLSRERRQAQPVEDRSRAGPQQCGKWSHAHRPGLGSPNGSSTMQPSRYWQDVTGTSDFPTVAEAVRQMWPQSGGQQLDGVLYLDPETLAALMRLTGPVTVRRLRPAPHGRHRGHVPPARSVHAVPGRQPARVPRRRVEDRLQEADVRHAAAAEEDRRHAGACRR